MRTHKEKYELAEYLNQEANGRWPVPQKQMDSSWRDISKTALYHGGHPQGREL